jgi:hypothetical protein
MNGHLSGVLALDRPRAPGGPWGTMLRKAKAIK